MSCLLRIKEKRSDLTERDQQIADYIESHKNKIVDKSTQWLANQTNTSPAAVNRFSKKLGYKGFPDLKLDLVSDLQNEIKELDNVLNKNDDIISIVNKAKQSNIQTIESTYNLLKLDTLEQVISAIGNANTIHLLGIGSSGIVCQDFQHKLLRIGKRVHYYSDSHLQLTNVPNITKQDVVLIVSYSGETKEMITAAKWLKDNHINTIAITKSTKNTLMKYVDLVITIPTEEKELRIGAMSSRLSSLLVVDLIYYGLVKNNIKETKKHITDTREIINLIED